MAFFKDYLELCKPRVVLLMIITAIVAMLMASPSGYPIPTEALLFGNLGIALLGFAGGTINQMVDTRIDKQMARTQNRPLASGRVSMISAGLFAGILAAAGMWVLFTYVNALTAWLSFGTLIGYAVFYSVFLKHLTPQNIVIGGLAGAMPPLLGWAAVTNSITASALLLVAIIFVWTPPHFWALAIYRYDDYAKAKVPMLPVTHGIRFTKNLIVLYSWLLVAVTYLPFVIDQSGLIYLGVITVLNIGFIIRAYRLRRSVEPITALKLFHYSITYLFALFVVLLLDHYIPILT